jgi:hypothetical protein
MAFCRVCGRYDVVSEHFFFRYDVLAAKCRVHAHIGVPGSDWPWVEMVDHRLPDREYDRRAFAVRFYLDLAAFWASGLACIGPRPDRQLPAPNGFTRPKIDDSFDEGFWIEPAWADGHIIGWTLRKLGGPLPCTLFGKPVIIVDESSEGES